MSDVKMISVRKEVYYKLKKMKLNLSAEKNEDLSFSDTINIIIDETEKEESN